ncbi:MAG: PaaI family thioesterase [Paracoccaceae bacterium]|nr:PaaI family thioesterase [Paracoccaceae bacterium]MDG2259144.1 PaaI family thioesterase [Paracoccaceae bacterium]
MDIKMNVAELNIFAQEVFPQVSDQLHVEEITDQGCIIRWKVDASNIRPGGTISGPTMFSAADVAAYLATLSRIGPEALAVTTNCSIDFMRKPAAGVDIIADCRLLKLGRVLSVSDVLIYSEGEPKPVARASLTYSIPPK